MTGFSSQTDLRMLNFGVGLPTPSLSIQVAAARIDDVSDWVSHRGTPNRQCDVDVDFHSLIVAASGFWTLQCLHLAD